VIYGERFIGRFDPSFDRDNKALTILQWWWQEDADPDNPAVDKALRACLDAFMKYLGAENLTLGEAARKDKALRRILS
jgi:uncharacterized protein YcaQ